MADIVDEPNLKSSDFREMEDYWVMVKNILGGAQAMRAAGESYLPRFQSEKSTFDPDGASYDPYQKRLEFAPFTNIYEDVSYSLGSKPFSKELVLDSDLPDTYQALGENIDGQGNNLHVFAQEWFQDGIDYGISWTMIDFDTAPQLSRPMTLAEERALGRKPYWVHVPALNLIAVYSDFVGGEEIIIHARIHEPSIESFGLFQERRVDRIRVLNRAPLEYDIAGKPISYGPATWEIYELVADENNTNASTWTKVEEGTFTLGYIPLVPFVTGRRSGTSFVVDPPLRAVAYMQIEEYQQESELKNIMQLACFPMLAGNGIEPPEDGSKIAVGPRFVLYGGRSVDGQAGSWNFIEPSGQSINQVASRLDKLQTNMRDLGKQPLIQTNLTVITTGQVAVKANSLVQAWALKFKDAMEQALKVTAEWMGDAGLEPEVNIHTDFAALSADSAPMQALLDMRKNKDLSRKSLIDAAMRFDYLPSDFDYEENEQELAEEQQGLEAEQPINPVTGQLLNQNVMPQQVNGGSSSENPLQAGQQEMSNQLQETT